MDMVTFEPGDGNSYRVLFGRLPSPTPLIPFYTVFGLAEGQDALITVVLDGPATEDSFLRRWYTAQHVQTINTPQQLGAMAYLLYLGLLEPHRIDEADAWADDVTESWAEDWESRLAAVRRRAGEPYE